MLKSLAVMKKLRKNTRTAIRITLIKGINDVDIEGYAKLIKIANPMFLEVKAYMWIGGSRKRLKEENMPFHREVVEFSGKLSEIIGYKRIDEQKESRVVLLMKEDTNERIMKF